MNSHTEDALHIPRLGGGDIELANYIVGFDNEGRSTGKSASRLLLAEVPGVLALGQTTKSQNSSAHDAGAHGRKFLPSNGGSVYIDLDHLELCLPEVIGVRAHLAAYHAMLRIARQALVRANRRLERLGSNRRVNVLVNNTDGQGSSYGSHLNLAMTRCGFNNLFRKPALLGGLASYQASSIIFCGQGKVGSENLAPPVDYQISQRADYCCTLSGQQTTLFRPVVNTRDEALCGRDSASSFNIARLHVIFYDSNLCHTAHFLKVGVLQIIVTMIEADALPAGLVLDDPIEATICWSHDPQLKARMKLASGASVTSVEHQRMWFEAAERFLSQGSYQHLIPDLDHIMVLWGKTLDLLEAAAETGDFEPLLGDLDWVLKQRCLEMAMDSHPHLHWDSPEIKQLDHCYSNLDDQDGLYWVYERNGIVNRIVSEDEINNLQHAPPENTRAWTRAKLLQRTEDEFDWINWDRIRYRVGFNRYQTLAMEDPFAMGRQETEELLRQSRTVQEIVNGLSGGRSGRTESVWSWV